MYISITQVMGGAPMLNHDTYSKTRVEGDNMGVDRRRRSVYRIHTCRSVSSKVFGVYQEPGPAGCSPLAINIGRVRFINAAQARMPEK